MLCATAGDIETDKASIIGFVNGCCMPNINKAKERYAAAIENGRKGGRPKTVDDEQVKELKEQGLSNTQIAAELSCSVSSVEKANQRNRKNLEIDMEKDIEKDSERLRLSRFKSLLPQSQKRAKVSMPKLFKSCAASLTPQ